MFSKNVLNIKVKSINYTYFIQFSGLKINFDKISFLHLGSKILGTYVIICM